MTRYHFKTLVGWCSDCEAYTNPPEKSCPGDEEFFDADDKLRRHDYGPRLMFICTLPNHCDGMAYLQREDLLAHERGLA